MAFAFTLAGMQLSPGRLALGLLGFNLGIEVVRLLLIGLVLTAAAGSAGLRRPCGGPSPEPCGRARAPVAGRWRPAARDRALVVVRCLRSGGGWVLVVVRCLGSGGGRAPVTVRCSGSRLVRSGMP
ncbi:hypothetical protein [Actinoplanes teichomyceticus]|nr:hypothetical protein [Actinoplanes teichomyceticus]